MAEIGKTQNTPNFFLNFLLEFTNIGPEKATWKFSERCFALYWNATEEKLRFLDFFNFMYFRLLSEIWAKNFRWKVALILKVDYWGRFSAPFCCEKCQIWWEFGLKLTSIHPSWDQSKLKPKFSPNLALFTIKWCWKPALDVNF